MSKSVTALLLVVVMAFSLINSIAEDLDLEGMTVLELKNLRTAINDELNKREQELRDSQPADAFSLHTKYKDLARQYRFHELIDIIDSGESGLSDAAAGDIRQYAEDGIKGLENVNFTLDEFTNRVFIFSDSVPNILGEECFQVVPYIDYEGFCLVLAFPEGSDIFYADDAYIKSDGESTRYSCSTPAFDSYDSDVWEYVTVSGIRLGESGTIDLIGLRADKSPRMENFVPTEKEQAAIKSVWVPACAEDKIERRLMNWLYGDDQGI